MFLLHSGSYLAHRNIKERRVIQYLVEDVVGEANLGMEKHRVASLVQFVFFRENRSDFRNNSSNQTKYTSSGVSEVGQKQFPENRPVP